MNLSLIVPELLVGGLAVILILLDLFMRGDKRSALSYVAIAGLAVIFIVTVGMASVNEIGFFNTIVVDPLSTFFKLLFLAAAALVILSAIDYVRDHDIAAGEFYATLLFATLGFMFLVSARELLTIYISLELASISLYILVGSMKRELRSSEAGLKYLLVGALSSAALLYGMALLYGSTGSTDITVIGQRLTTAGPIAAAAIVLIAAGVGFKMAAVPFHMWAPDVYQGAPTPVTAYLSVVSKSAGFVLALRLFGVGLAGLENVWPALFAVLAAITMTVGNVGALRQTSIKRLMGYSSIGQAGYALMALAVPTLNVGSSLVFFLLAYTLTNIGAFAGIIALSRRVGSDDLADFRGVAQRARGLSLLTTLCFLSLIGMPPMAGFFSKFYLFLQVYQDAGDRLLWLLIVAVLNTAIAAFYYINVVRAMYMAAPASEEPLRATAPLGLTLAASVVAILIIGIFPTPFITAATNAAGSIFGQ